MTTSAQGSSFGLGYLAATATGSYPKPLIFGLLKDVSLDFDMGAVKTIEGQYRYALMAGRGPGKLTGKASYHSLFGNTFGHMAGITPTTGSVVGVPGEVWTIPDTPYQVTTTNHTVWLADHGVMDLTANIEMQPAATATGAGVYAVASGVYTFNVADKGHIVSISYPYTAAAIGQTSGVLQAAQGLADMYELYCFNSGPSTAVPDHIFGFKFPSVVMTKLTSSLKVGDWATHDLSFEIICATGTLYSVYSGA